MANCLLCVEDRVSGHVVTVYPQSGAEDDRADPEIGKISSGWEALVSWSWGYRPYVAAMFSKR